MRPTVLIVVSTLGMAATWAVSARAAPMIPNPTAEPASNIVQVWGGCGWGWHPTYWGGCVPNRRYYYRPYWGYRRYGYYRPYWHRHYWHRHW